MTDPGPSIVPELELPALYRQADATAARKQRTFLRATQVRLALLVLAALGGALTFKVQQVEMFGALSAAAFASVAFLELYLWQTRPEQAWYRARAVAESVKTLAWRYATRAAPFDDDLNVDQRYLKRLRTVHAEVGSVLISPDNGNVRQVSASMQQMRESEHAVRKSAYLEQRLDNQIRWYSDKSRWNERRSATWSIAMVVLNVVGLVMSMLRAMCVMDLDVAGIIGAFAAAGIAWVQTRQYSSLAAAYATTHHELTIVRERVSVTTEADWPQEVSDAEEAISREHTMWLASRSAAPFA